MAIGTETKDDLMEGSVYLHNAISALKMHMTDHEIERNAVRKAEWYSFRKKYNDGLNKIEESLKDMSIC
jgi:hypothetical protein